MLSAVVGSSDEITNAPTTATSTTTTSTSTPTTDLPKMASTPSEEDNHVDVTTGNATFDQFHHVEDISDNNLDLQLDLTTNKTEPAFHTTNATTTTTTSSPITTTTIRLKQRVTTGQQRIKLKTSTISTIKRPGSVISSGNRPGSTRPSSAAPFKKSRPGATVVPSLSSLSNATSRVGSGSHDKNTEYAQICTLGARLIPAQCFNCQCGSNGFFNEWACVMDGECMTKKKFDDATSSAADSMQRDGLLSGSNALSNRKGVAGGQCQHGHLYQEGCQSCVCSENGHYQCRDLCSRSSAQISSSLYNPTNFYGASSQQPYNYPLTAYPGWGPWGGAGNNNYLPPPQSPHLTYHTTPSSLGGFNPFLTRNTYLGYPSYGQQQQQPSSAVHYGQSNLTTQTNKLTTKRRSRMYQKQI